MEKLRKMIYIFLLICLCYNTLANKNKSCDCELLQVYDPEDPDEFTCEQNITLFQFLIDLIFHLSCLCLTTSISLLVKKFKLCLPKSAVNFEWEKQIH